MSACTCKIPALVVRVSRVHIYALTESYFRCLPASPCARTHARTHARTRVHTMAVLAFSLLSFSTTTSYEENGKLDCFCRKHPCPHFTCTGTPDTPVVSWDQEGHCHCMAEEHDEL